VGNIVEFELVSVARSETRTSKSIRFELCVYPAFDPATAGDRRTAHLAKWHWLGILSEWAGTHSADYFAGDSASLATRQTKQSCGEQTQRSTLSDSHLMA